jgi:hypothetical protein
MVKDKYIESQQNQEAQMLLKIENTGTSQSPNGEDTISSKEQKLVAQF